MLLIDPENGAILDANAAACHFYGYEGKELNNMNINQINTLSREEIIKEMHDAKTENRKHFFFNHRLSNGEIRNVEVYSGPIHWEGKDVLYSIIHDITQRINAEAEIIELNRTLDEKVLRRTLQLKSSNAMLEEVNSMLEEEIAERIRIEECLNQTMLEVQDLYDNAPCGYHSLDRNGLFLRMNQTELGWLGYSKEELIGKMKFTEIITQESQNIFKENYNAFIERGWVNDLEFTMISKTGELREVLLSGSAIKDDQGQFIMSRSTVYDNSRRKEAEDQLVSLNNELEKKVEERTVNLKETNGMLEETNAMLEETNAMLEEEITDRIKVEQQYQISEASLRSAQKIAHLGSWVWDVPYNKLEWSDGMYLIFGIEKNSIQGSLKEVITRVIHPDDLELVLPSEGIQSLVTKKTLEYRVYWPDQSIHYIWSKIGDIIFDEEGKVLFIAGISQDVTERRIIENAKIQAEAASDAKSTFLANMSHEIRTPINAIIGFNHLIQKTQLTVTQRDYVDKTILSAKNLLGLVNDVLDFSKIEANKIALESSLFDLYEVLNSISNIVSFDLYEKELKLNFSIDPSVPQFVKGDAFRLNQILLNLVNNSIKFTEEGTITITLKLEQRNKHQVLIRFSIEDTGIGMSGEQQLKLFNAFSQVDMSTTRKYGGSGLGLSISRNLIELMGGNISVKSELGLGSEFSFTVWLEANKAIKSDGNNYFKFNNLNVLLVCGPGHMVSVIESQFEDFNLLIKTVRDLNEAVQELVGTQEYQLILVDVQLAENIKEAADEIKRAIGNKSSLTMLISSYKVQELELLGYDEFISGIFYYPMGKSQIYDKLSHIFADNLDVPLTSDEGKKVESYNKLSHTLVLLVEDNEINQELAKAILEEFGLQIDLAENGCIALRMMLKKKYDLVLMDLQMPVMDGYEAARRIRSISAYDDIPIIAMSAHAVIGIKEKVYETGMNDYITKPFEVSKMIATLKEWIK